MAYEGSREVLWRRAAGWWRVRAEHFLAQRIVLLSAKSFQFIVQLVPLGGQTIELSLGVLGFHCVFSYQLDSVGPHQHKFIGAATRRRMDANEQDRHYDHDDLCLSTPSETLTNAGTETRPKNAYVHYVIKF
jgi:hypothetical protein